MTGYGRGEGSCRRRPSASAYGFTLLELMTTLVVASIVLSVGVPSFVDIARNSRAAANANELVSALSLARSEAIRRSARVGVCGTSDGASCDGSWDQGWIVFVDEAASDALAPTVGAVLREWPAPSGGGEILTRAGGASVAMAWVRFLPRGEVRASHPLPVVYRIEIEGCSGMQGRDIELNAIGRTSVERIACG